jgi:lipopolysaccharide transport system permease protein
MGARLPGSSSTFSYGIYLIAGIVPWTAFSNTVSRSATVFLEKKGIISGIKISLAYLPFYIVLSETVIFLITFFVYVMLLVFKGHPIHGQFVLIPFLYLVQQIFAYGLGLFIGVFNVFIRDLKEVTNILLQIWFWFTPIVYVVDILPDFTKKWFQYNPAYLFIKAYQDILVFGVSPNYHSLMTITIIGHGFLALSYVCYKKLEKDIRDFI